MKNKKKSCILTILVLLLFSLSLLGCQKEKELLEDTISETGSIPETENISEAEFTEETKEASSVNGTSLRDRLTKVEGIQDGWIIALDTLNVRKFCYSYGRVIGTFSSGQKIQIQGPAKYGFYPVVGTDAVTGEEIKGYCSEKYVSLIPYEGNEICLEIPSYLQIDERWSESKLGDSKYTIGQVGCTTTCFAMCESYLSEEEVTPLEMSERLTYTQSGNLFWPSGYQQDYTTEYLTEIYLKLHQGIPVLMGSRRKSGGQHWVLVTGYDPGSKTIRRTSDLKSSDFIIQDPMGKRTTLAAYFRDLPYYIKIVYYTGK